MGIKATLSKPLAALQSARIRHWSADPHTCQQKNFQKLLHEGCKTSFGKEHGFEIIKSLPDFRNQVPLRDYEGFTGYIERIAQGDRDVLWPGLPLYFAKSSGTTSGVKYIPITSDSLPNHLNSARDALFMYIQASGNASFSDYKMIFLQGSPVLDKHGSIPSGRLSGIVANHVPLYLLKNRLPSYATNCIKDWETKLDAIVTETLPLRMSLISGIPPWVKMYFEKLVAVARKPVGEIFPDFSLFVFGGVNSEPYKASFNHLIGKEIDSVEVYPASEGFIAYQDTQPFEGLLLNVNSGIYYEFVPATEISAQNPVRLSLQEVETGIDYAIVLSNNAGLWGYVLGDLVRFVSTTPYRLIVSGRISQFTSTFGEHVIASEVEKALAMAVERFPVRIREFTVAPYLAPEYGNSYHEWLIEFESTPADIQKFGQAIDSALQQLNPYYRDLIEGKVLKPLELKSIAQGTFLSYLRNQGKLGEQNKVPRLSNDRKVVEGLLLEEAKFLNGVA